MGVVLDFRAAGLRLRPVKLPAPVALDPLVEAAIRVRRMWVSYLGIAFALWGLELRERSGADDDDR